MSSRYGRIPVAYILYLLLLLSCSGGESGTGAKSGPQVDKPVGSYTGNIAQGVVTGFGSIYLNGVEYNTDTAVIYLDDVPATESDLKVGMVVTVVGTVNDDGLTGTALLVSAKSELQGIVDQNKVTGGVGTLTVMLQTIHVNKDTRFKPGNSGLAMIDELQAKTHVIQVRGFSDSQGDIYATYISVVDNPVAVSEVKLSGAISNLTATGIGGNFHIGSMLVKFDSNTQFDVNLTQQALVNGITIGVESSDYSGTGPVTASKLKLDDVVTDTQGSEMEIQGIVTEDSMLSTESWFVLNDRIVRIDGDTVIMGGSTAGITKEAPLQVEGQVQADSSLLAQQIEFRMSSDMEIVGTVTDISGDTLTISNVSATQQIKVDSLTIYEDETDPSNQYFYYSDITPGTNVEVKYYLDTASGGYKATSVEKVL